MVWTAFERLGSSVIPLWAYHRPGGRLEVESRKPDQKGKKQRQCTEGRSKEVCTGPDGRHLLGRKPPNGWGWWHMPVMSVFGGVQAVG